MVSSLGSREVFQREELLRQTRIMEVEGLLRRYQAAAHPQHNVSYWWQQQWKGLRLELLVGATERKCSQLSGQLVLVVLDNS